MKLIRLLPAAALLVAIICPAFAADAIFPPGVRVGMTPLVGLIPAKAFVGFESEDHGVKVLGGRTSRRRLRRSHECLQGHPGGCFPAFKPESIETAAGTAYYTVEKRDERRHQACGAIR